jgi:hypothetical protein
MVRPYCPSHALSILRQEAFTATQFCALHQQPAFCRRKIGAEPGYASLVQVLHNEIIHSLDTAAAKRSKARFKAH